MNKITRLFISISLMGFIISSCKGNSKNDISASSGAADTSESGSLNPTDTSKLVWPGNGQKARIKFVQILQNNKDFVATRGGETAPTVSLSYPKAVVTDPGEKFVYVSDRIGIWVFEASSGKISKFADSGANSVKNGRGMAVASDGRVFIADLGDKDIKVYSQDNRFIKSFGKGTLENPQGTLINNDRFFVADTNQAKVFVYNLNGNLLFTLANSGMLMPTQIAADSAGSLYVLNQGVRKVHVFSQNGNFVRSMIDSGSRAGNLFRPKGIALDSENHIYITDAVFNNFQIFDTQGQLLLFVGTAGSNPGQFKSPSLIHIDSKDRIYVAEFAGQRIQVFQYLGQKYAETNPQGI